MNVDLSGGDLGPPKQPAQGSAETGVRIPPGTTEAGHTNTVITTTDRKKGKKEKVNNKKENRKERKSGGWRATLLSCFVCGGGGDGKDEWETSVEEERLRIEERTRRAREADLQRFLKLRKVTLMRKENFKRMLRRRKMTEANKEWSALPPRPEEDAESKVTFREVDACDVWFYQEEANPRLGQAWKRVLQEIKDNKMARALQAKWRKKEKQPKKSEEKEVIIKPLLDEEEMDRLCEFLMAVTLSLGSVVLVYIWYLLSLLP